MTALEAAGDTCSKAVDAFNIHLHWSRTIRKLVIKVDILMLQRAQLTQSYK